MEHPTAFDLLKESFESSNQPLVTFSQALDKILGGGIFFKQITEIFGGKGLGKTTLCLQLALNIQIPKSLSGQESECLFIDTENTFVVQRLETMATKLAEHCISVSSTALNISTVTLMDGIHYMNCRSATELEEIIEGLDEYLNKHSKIRLIIIDSIAFPFYTVPPDFDSRTKRLYTMAQGLRDLMNKFCLAIIVTNSMTTRFTKEGEEYYVPYLGESWAYVPNRRIQLELENNCRKATLVKCSFTRPGSTHYRVLAEGIRD